MRRPSFDRIARAVVSSALASLASLGAGCGDDGDGVGGGTGGGGSGEPIDLEGMTAPACLPSQAIQLLDGAGFTSTFDSIDLVYDQGFGEREVAESVGTRCATATDGDACQAAVDALIVTPEEGNEEQAEGFQLGGCADVCPKHYLVTTQGDDVVAFRTKEQMLALLGPIDTPIDAFWAAGLERYTVGCDASIFGARAVDGGWEVAATRLTSICEPIETTQYLLSVKEDASISVLQEIVIESSGGCVGRRPACLRDGAGRGDTPIGARLAALARLEAASIPAFAALSRELAALGAPRSLSRAARRAKADEVRHAREMRRHARRFGGRIERPTAPTLAPRPLVDVAIENAVEGCVREAFGAVVARLQARRAADPALRRSLRRIARDEAEHATLSLRVDAWARRRLDEPARARVEQARAAALAELREQVLADDPGAAASSLLGLPRPAEARVLFAAFEAAIAAQPIAQPTGDSRASEPSTASLSRPRTSSSPIFSA